MTLSCSRQGSLTSRSNRLRVFPHPALLKRASRGLEALGYVSGPAYVGAAFHTHTCLPSPVLYFHLSLQFLVVAGLSPDYCPSAAINV